MKQISVIWETSPQLTNDLSLPIVFVHGWKFKIAFFYGYTIVRSPGQLTKIYQAHHVNFYSNSTAPNHQVWLRSRAVALSGAMEGIFWKALLAAYLTHDTNSWSVRAPCWLRNICPLSRKYSRPSTTCSIFPVPLCAVSPHGHMLPKALPEPHPFCFPPLPMLLLAPRIQFLFVLA